jgi:hypothetical protein
VGAKEVQRGHLRELQGGTPQQVETKKKQR